MDARTISDAEARWARAGLALSVLAVNPTGLGGLWLRARSGPARDRFLAALDALPLPLRKIHPGISDTQLYGGLDLSATLGGGKVVNTAGILTNPCAIVLTMAERCPAGLAARLATALDQGTHTLIALDEGADSEEVAPPSLTEPLGLFVTLDDIPLSALSTELIDAGAIATVRQRLPQVTCPDALRDDLVTIAATLGVSSLRAPLLALAAARTIAALFGEDVVQPDHIRLAAELVFAHRATAFPDAAEAQEAETPPPPPEDAQTDGGDTESDQDQSLPQEILLEAVQAALPPDVLAALAAGRATRARSGAAGSGATKRGNRRGRPLPSRPGRLDGQSRIDLVATLRAAAPWQPMRRKAAPQGHSLHIRAEDIRVRRFEERSDRLLVFAVDASGSAAMARLAEAKGAVELLLAEAYARRDHVALVAFRGTAAELLLPPTRSLVQTKRRLAALPGGGGTPLAAGLETAMDIARRGRDHGMTPTLVVLTDGRANIALDGSADRRAAGDDAQRLARLCAGEGVPGLVIDTSVRPQPALATLAQTMDAPYLAMPRADAHRLSAAVSDRLDA
ncbi:MAG: magnesium chelatase subunit D [Pseudomonadota bacterium]